MDNDTVQMTLRLDPEIHAWLTRQAERQRVSMAHLVRGVLVRHMRADRSITVTPEQIVEAEDLLLRGLTTRAVAARLGLSRAIVEAINEERIHRRPGG